MNALPLTVSAAGLPAPQAGDAAVLPPALLTMLATAPTTPVATLPTFDRTLQLLLDGAAAALPLAGAQAGDPAAMPETALGEDGTDAEADAGTALHFDPALASLQPPPATLALAQANQAAWSAATAAMAAPLADTAPTTTPAPALAALASTPALAPQPAIPAAAAAAAAATELLADTDPASAPKAAAGATAQPAPARPVAALATTAVPAEPLTLPHERSPGIATLVLPQSGAADGVDSTTAARSTETTPQGRAPSLLQALSERIAVQSERGTERVVIRLDPPYRGQIEIHIRQDATGATQIQLNASHADVVRQLHAIGDSLRQELAQRQGGDVSVQIAQHSREQDGRQQRQDRQGEQQQPGRALDEQASSADTARFALATDRP